MKKIIIYTPSYNENSGGIVVLHYLCHLANSIGYEAYLVKSRELVLFDFKQPLRSVFRILRGYFNLFFPLKTNKSFNTPVLRNIPKNLDDFMVVYYEQLIGNPLNAKNVIRYMLHFPGYHTGNAFYCFNEYHILWEETTNVMDFPHCERQKFPMKVTYMLDNIYNKTNSLEFNKRSIDCFMIRKGINKPFIHKDSAIKLDGLSHNEIAKIFKKSRYFYCYDEYTMYSRFAAMCGCIPIVVPDNESKKKEDWNISKYVTYGIAYGVTEIEKAKEENLTLDKLIQEEKEILLNGIEKSFVSASLYFSKKRYDIFKK